MWHDPDVNSISNSISLLLEILGKSVVRSSIGESTARRARFVGGVVRGIDGGSPLKASRDVPRKKGNAAGQLFRPPASSPGELETWRTGRKARGSEMEIVGGEKRERLLGLSFLLLLSRSSRYPFSSSRDPSWNQIQFQTDLSLPGWEKSVVVPLDLSGRGSLRTLSTSDQKQGGCYNKLGDSNARNACQYRGNLRTEWTLSRKIVTSSK